MTSSLTSDADTMRDGGAHDLTGSEGQTDAGAPVQYRIGVSVNCTNGPSGELSRVVINPITRSVTHLVIEPHHRHAMARLVPVSLAEVGPDEIRLRCTRAQLRHLQLLQEREFLPADPYRSGSFPVSGMLAWPYYRPAPTVVVHDRLPLGEVEIRRSEHVHAPDGAIGRVQGLVVDPADQHVTHVLLQEGHLWGAKDVAIPIGAITGIDGAGVHVSTSKHAIADLPEIELEPPVAR